MVDTDCVFCAIVAGTAPASVAYRDDEVIAFCDIEPFTPGHLLVVPVRHATGLADLDPDTGGRLFQVGQTMAGALRRSGLRCDGVNFFLADGAAAFQTVFHLHLHVVPRWRGDGVRLHARRRHPNAEQLDLTAAAVRRGLRDAHVRDGVG